MRLLYHISAFFFLLCQRCVLGFDDAVCSTIQDEYPGWADLRDCLKGCIYYSSFGTQCPVASFLGCGTRACMCKPSYRESALDNLKSCVKDKCQTTNEPSQAVDIFNTFCGGVVVFSSVGPGSFNDTPLPTVTIWSATTDEGNQGIGTDTAYHSTAQQGVALLWDTLITLMMSVVGAIIWDLVAV